uniref:PDEase domain-containing protein n=1 Tax=Arcella intermedia TaxID=1963864 RepID=A0A6B2L4I7_9EUKA
MIIKDFASDEEYDEEKNTKQSTNDFEIALSPVRPFKFIELLNTTLNPGSVPMNVIEELNSLNFDIFPYKDSNDEEFLILLLMQMFHKTGVMHEFNIPESTLYRFIKTVAMRYRSVPYHNFFHAWNVCQTMYFFLQSCGAGNFFNSYEVLALLIAALCHDCDHPGLNNTFQVKASTRVSILHKKSILENHHLFHCYNILSQPECNILQNMKHTDRKAVEWRISKLILATDLAFHGFIHDKLVEKKKTFVKFTKLNETKTVDDISQTEEEDRILLLCCLIKGGDLSNEIRPTNIAQRWAKLVIKEFFEQSKTERSLDLAVTPFMDPQKVILSKEQINFIEGLCLPLYEPLSTIFPPMALCVKQLLTNKAEWNNRLLNFFSNDMASIKKLPNTSIWERDQEGKKWNKKNLLSLLNQTKEK